VGCYGERFARAYNGGLKAEPPVGSRGRAPVPGPRGFCPLKDIHFFDALRRAKFGLLCEEYQELTPFLGFVHVWLIQESHIFQWADKKNWPPTLHQIFRVCREHKCGHNDVVLRGFDEGILRGKGEEKYLTPYLPMGVFFFLVANS